MYRMPRHPSSASPFLGLYPTALVLEYQGKFLALSDLDEHSYKEERIVISRGVEIVKFSTCPGTSKWP